MADQKITDLSPATPSDTDSIPVARSGGTNARFLWSAVKSAIKTYTDTLYGTISAVSAAQSTADAKYSLPGTGIPAADLAAGVQTALSDAREWTAATVSQAEAEAGTATTRRAWTAERVRQAIAAWWAGASTAAGRAIVTAADAAAQRSALGLGAAIQGAVGVSDNRLIRADGTGGATVQGSGITLGDANELSGYRDALTNITTTGPLTLSVDPPVQRIVLDAVRQITMPTDPGPVGCAITVILLCQSFTPTWSGVTWLTSDGNAPTLSTTSGKRNVLVFIWDDNAGGTGAWLGMLGGSQQ